MRPIKPENEGNMNNNRIKIPSQSEPDHSGPTPTTLKIIVEYLEQGEVHLFQILVNPGTQARDVIRMLASELGSTDFELYHHPAVLPFEYPMFQNESVYELAVKGFKFYLKSKPSVLSRLGRFIEANYYINNKSEIEKKLKESGL